MILIISTMLLGCTEPTEQQLNTVNITQEEYTSVKNTIQTQQEEINAQQTKVIELQENNEFLRKQKVLFEEKFVELEDVYSNLFGDATSCYWANYCLYFEDMCVETFKNDLIGWTARDIHISYSDMCDTMYRDWEEYQSFDKELMEEI